MADLAALVARLEKVATRLESLGLSGGAAAGGAAGAGDSAGGPSLEGFDEIVNGSLKKFLDLSSTIGGDVKKQADLVAAAFQAQRDFLGVVATSKAPSQDGLVALLGPTSKAIGEIQTLRDSNRRSPQFNHLCAVADGIPALGWVTMAPKPAPYIQEMVGAAQFYTNRVLKDFKDTDKTQVEWARAFIAVLEDLQKFVKAAHTTGPAWNPKGGEAKLGASSAPKAAEPAKPAAAPSPAKPAAAAGAPHEGQAKSALFAALSGGEGVTSGLKKVDKSQMTHKNPELRASSVVPAPSGPLPVPKAAGAAAGKAAIPDKPARTELDGKKWIVEYHKAGAQVVLDDVSLKQTVYIYRCQGATIQIKGKVNSITVDGCSKTGVVFQDCMSAFEVVNCQGIQIQVLGKVNTVSIDKTDGAQVFLSQESIDAQIVTAKSSEMNISVPVGQDFLELAVPEQYKTVFDPATKKLVTEPTDIAS